MPSTTPTSQPKGIVGDNHSTCVAAMIIPKKPSSEPTERSICRVTITKTIPVATIPTTLACTTRFQRLRGVKKVPSVTALKISQITSSAPNHTEQPGVKLERPQQAAETALRLLSWRFFISNNHFTLLVHKINIAVSAVTKLASRLGHSGFAKGIIPQRYRAYPLSSAQTS